MLIKGSDYFVDGSSRIAKSLGVPSIVIGLTLVAIGTSLPELAVSLTASLRNNNDLSVSNVVGSNFFNLFVILGFTSLIRNVFVDKKVVCHDYHISLYSLVLLLVIVLFYHFISGYYVIGRIGGLLLLFFFGIYFAHVLKGKREGKSNVSVLRLYDVFWMIVGLIFIIIGGEFTVHSASLIALKMGVSERIIGLTIVSIGTSLPEFFTSLVAIIKKEEEIAIGNILGSNIINTLLIIGISSFFSPIYVSVESIFDLSLLVVGYLFVLIFILRDYKVTRYEGLWMIFFYLGYVIYVLIR